MYKVLFSLVIISFFSCVDKNGTKSLRKVAEVEIDISTLNFPLPDYTFTLKPDNRNNMIYFLIDSDNIIVRMDLNEEKIDTFFSYGLDQNISHLDGVEPSFEKLILTNSSFPGLYIADKRTGLINDVIDFRNDIEGYSTSQSYVSSRFNTNIIQGDKSTYVFQYLWSLGKTITADQIQNHPLFIKINNENMSKELVEFRYPSSFLENNIIPNKTYFSVSGKEDLTLVSFCYYPVIHKINFKDNSKIEINCFSEYFDDFAPENNGFIDHLAKSGRFAQIHFDEQNNLIYQVVKLPWESNKQANMEDTKYTNDFSIIVYDSELN